MTWPSCDIMTASQNKSKSYIGLNRSPKMLQQVFNMSEASKFWCFKFDKSETRGIPNSHDQSWTCHEKLPFWGLIHLPNYHIVGCLWLMVMYPIIYKCPYEIPMTTGYCHFWDKQMFHPQPPRTVGGWLLLHGRCQPQTVRLGSRALFEVTRMMEIIPSGKLA